MSKKKKFNKGIAKLGRQLYEVLVTRRDPRSKSGRSSRRRTVRGSRHEAEAVRRQLEEELDGRLRGRADDATTLTGYVQQWLEARSGGLKPSTLVKYMNDLDKHILPALGHMRLEDLRPRDIVGFLSRDEGAPNSKKNRLALLRVLAKDAIADALVDRDFCLRVSVKVPDVYTEEEPNLLDNEQFARLLEQIPQYWQDLACVLSLTGLRWGEVSALHWDDVDLDRRVVVVRWNNWKGKLLEPKTQQSRRTVPLAEALVFLLQERYERMRRETPGLFRTRLVFPTRTGGLHKGTPLNRVLKDACRRAGITIRFTPHGFRRTWNDVARRVADGVVVRSMIGHASEAMTDHYSWVDRSERRATSETVADHLTARTRLGRQTADQGAEGDGQEGGGQIARSCVETDGQVEAEAAVATGQPDGSPEVLLVDKTVDAGAATPASEGPKSE